MPFRLKVSLAVLLSLLTIALVGPLIVPILPVPDTVPEAQLADPDSQFVEVDGVTVHYKTAGVEGEGPTFVLIHGFGSSTYTWHEVMADFGELGRVIAFDLPAFGLTERPLPNDWDSNPYTPQAQVDLTLGLLDALNIGQAVLIGHSSGGVVAAQVAVKQPERVAGLVLVDAPILSGGRNAPRFLLRLPQINRLGPVFMRQFAGQPGTDFLRNAWSDPDSLDEETLEAYRKPLQANDWDRALWEYAKVNGTVRLEPDLPRLSLPTLVLTGTDDEIVPPEQSERLAETLPDATLEAFEDCGHVPHEECPAPFTDAVTTWLQEQNATTDF